MKAIVFALGGGVMLLACGGPVGEEGGATQTSVEPKQPPSSPGLALEAVDSLASNKPLQVVAPPPPYDPVRDIHNGDPFASADRSRSPDAPASLLSNRSRPQKGGGPQPAPPPGTGDQGFWINAGVGSGVLVVNDLRNELNLPAPGAGQTITLYAPTTQAPGGSCVETVRIHQRAPGDVTRHWHGFWDWCRASPGWGSAVVTDSTWQAAYVRDIEPGGNGLPQYATQVVNYSGNCWAGAVYNYTTNTWDNKLFSCGTTQTGFGAFGWTMWESYGLTGFGICPSLPRIRSRYIQVQDTTGWHFLTPTMSQNLGPSSGSCYDLGFYFFHVLTANNAWEADTP